MKVLLTGGHGFIGSRVTALLVSQGLDVRCLVRPKSRTSRIDTLKVERVVGDILDTPSLVSAMEGCDACIHLASIVSWDSMRSQLLERTIVEGTRQVLDAAVASGIRRLVYVSSSSAINGSNTPCLFDESSEFELSSTSLRYAKAKHLAEKICRTALSCLEVIIVNPVETYGPNDVDLITARNLRDILRGWPAIGCHGGTAIAHVDDVATGISRALHRGRPGERYILGGENLTIEQLIRLTLKIAGQKKPVVILPNVLIRVAINGLSRLRLPTPLLPDVVDYATRFWFVDTSKAKRELGYEFRSANEVLEPTIRWLYASGLTS